LQPLFVRFLMPARRFRNCFISVRKRLFNRFCAATASRKITLLLEPFAERIAFMPTLRAALRGLARSLVCPPAVQARPARLGSPRPAWRSRKSMSRSPRCRSS
jgi:hypothetical protein